jgi:hypothetical protein
MSAQVTHFGLEPLVPRLELPDLLGEGIDSALLLVGVGRAVECVATESLFEEPEQSARPLQVGLINPPRHRVGQSQGQDAALPSKKKSEVSREGVIYCEQMTPLSRQNHLCLLSFT